MTLTHDDVARYFTRTDGGYTFARWGRPIAPVVFGVEDDTLQTIKGAFEAVAKLTGQEIAETDPELGSNVMMFFFRDWSELPDVPNLEKLVPDLVPLVNRLEAENASQYRAFRFDSDGAIQACFVFLRMRGALAKMPAETLALSQVVSAILLWSDMAFAAQSPLAQLENGHIVLRPEVAQIIRAAYDPIMPASASDPAHALRLAARVMADLSTEHRS